MNGKFTYDDVILQALEDASADGMDVAILSLGAPGAVGSAVDGIRDWQVYLDELDRLLAAPPSRPPGVGVTVRAAGAAASNCH